LARACVCVRGDGKRWSLLIKLK